jgi:hypothetical protein
MIVQKQNLMEAIVVGGQADGSIRPDVDSAQLTTLVMGSMRMNVLKWRLSGFQTDLVAEGNNLKALLKSLLSP